jgi:metal-responsive CopG/Arc/MetJ family transcriptional regulator
MSPVLVRKAPKAEIKPVVYRGPKELVAEIDSAAKELGLTRTEAITQFLRYALEAHHKDTGKKAKK